MFLHNFLILRQDIDLVRLHLSLGFRWIDFTGIVRFRLGRRRGPTDTIGMQVLQQRHEIQPRRSSAMIPGERIINVRHLILLDRRGIGRLERRIIRGPGISRTRPDIGIHRLIVAVMAIATIGMVIIRPRRGIVTRILRADIGGLGFIHMDGPIVRDKATAHQFRMKQTLNRRMNHPKRRICR